MIFFREYTVLLALLLVLLVSGLLMWNTSLREADLRLHKMAMRNAVLDNAAAAIDTRLKREQATVHLFAAEAGKAIARVLSERRDADRAQQWLRDRLLARFPEMMTYAISDAQGVAVYKADEFTADTVCKVDLAGYAHDVDLLGQAARNKVFIHPRPGEYHFDVMAPYKGGNGQRGILFVSLSPQAIAGVLRQYRLPGHQLMLVRESDPALIEITAEGSRDRLTRDIRLADNEVQHIADSRQIEGTDWRLIDLQTGTGVQAAVDRLWRETFFAIAGVGLLALLLLALAWRAARQRARAE